jgi:hypothetical protein
MTTDDASRAQVSVRVELLHVTNCPNVDSVREVARRSLSESGIRGGVEELEGDYPSPTLLVDGLDVVTGRPPAAPAACRLDLPTTEQILTALRKAVADQVRRAAFRGLLVRGEPIAPSELGLEGDLSHDAVSTAVAQLAAAGRIEVAGSGTIVGSAGLSVVPSRHQLRILDRWFWTWCAWDAVGILGALRASGAIRSPDPLSAAVIELTFARGEPEPSPAVVFRARDEGLYSSIRDEYCPLTNLFADEAGAKAWSRTNMVPGDALAVAPATAEAAMEWNPLVAGVTLP